MVAVGIPDNLDLWETHDAEMERRRDNRPKCDCCGEPIQDDYQYKIDGEVLCLDCVNYTYREEVTEN